MKKLIWKSGDLPDLNEEIFLGGKLLGRVMKIVGERVYVE